MHSLFAQIAKPITHVTRTKQLPGQHHRCCSRRVVAASIKPTLVEVVSAVRDGILAPFDAARTIEKMLCPETLVTQSVFPKILDGRGKHPKWIGKQMDILRQEHGCVLVTGVESVEATEIQKLMPRVQYDSDVKILSIKTREAAEKLLGTVAAVSDCSVSAASMKEWTMLADYLGCNVEQADPISVTNITDTIFKIKNMHHANVIVVIYDEERALPDVVSGLTDAPVIAVRIGDHRDSDFPSGCVSTDSLISAAYSAAKMLKSGERLMASVMRPTEMEMITAQTISIDKEVKDALEWLSKEAKQSFRSGNGINNVIVKETTETMNGVNGSGLKTDFIV